MARLFIACSIAFGTVLHASAPPPPGPLTAEELFHTSEFGGAQLSPDGQHLGAIVADNKDLKNLLIYDLKDFKPSGIRASGIYEIASFRWLNDSQVVLNVSKDTVYSWGLYSARLGYLEHLVPIDSYDVTQIIGIPKTREGRVLVWVTQASRDEGRPGGLIELDVDRPSDDSRRAGAYSRNLVRSYQPPDDGPVTEWRTDRTGELALCTTWSQGESHLHRYVAASKTWVRVPGDGYPQPMGFDFDPRYLWVVSADERAGYSLCRMNLETGEMDAPILTDPKYDIGTGHLYYSEATHRIAGVTYMKRRGFSTWFSSTFASAQAAIDRLRPGTDNILVDHDRADRKFLFELDGPRHPASYELLDLDSKTLTPIDDSAPALKGRPLHTVQSVSFATRDGVQLEGYMALPEGASAAHPVPLVVLVHGGPWTRDTNWFNPEVQFLVSRGYAVFQPNYRGSSGYAPDISHERKFDFMRMNDDVTDATKAILSTGLIDPKRVGIMGASFGGYLAVSGVAFQDGLYRCAISECGVFDWKSHVSSKQYVGRPAEYEMLTDELGKPNSVNKRLEDLSPLGHVDHIHVPVLVAHGTEDNVVDISQSRELVAALKQRGIPCETFYRPLEGHGFFNYENRVAFFHRVEAFLAENLGGATLTH